MKSHTVMNLRGSSQLILTALVLDFRLYSSNKSVIRASSYTSSCDATNAAMATIARSKITMSLCMVTL